METNEKTVLKHPEMAAIIRGMLKFKKELLELDPWLPFPQNTCCYSFGAEGRPLPIGALFILWEKWPVATRPCSICGGASFGYGWGGLFSLGGAEGYCSVCGYGFFQQLGGLHPTLDKFRPFLKDTPYFVKESMFGGTYEGTRPPLVNALRKLRAADLPGDEWTQVREPCRVSFTIPVGGSGQGGPFDWDGFYTKIFWAIGIALVMGALRNAGPFLAQFK